MSEYRAPRRRRIWRTCVQILSIVMATACGAVSGVGERPPPSVVAAGDARIELQPYTVCWSTATSGYCADGTQPSPLPSLGAIKENIEIYWPLAGWDFVASIHQVGKDAIDVELGEVED